jgi:glycosidase
VTTGIPPTGGWWQVYPLGFLGAERSALPADAPVQHRLPRLAQWLAYAVSLGVEGLVLGPVFASETHGYDTVDHFRVDARLGTEDDLVQFVAATHEVGLRVVLDGVFNHVGRGFGPFVELAAKGPKSPFAQWFLPRPLSADGETLGQAEGSTRAQPDAEPEVEVFEGHRHLVRLNHDEPAVVEHVRSVLDYWCSRGLDGWRLDAAYAVPTDFWRQVLSPMRERHPEVWVFAELIHGDYAGFVRQSGVDSATQYELWKAIGSAINDANFFELAWALKRHADLLDAFVPVTFVGNHDTTRIASRLTDPRHLPHALAVLFGVGGTPVIYSGDEQAFRGIKYEREGGDDEIRPAFPASPDELSRLGEDTFSLHQRLIGMRRARPWLATARTAVVELANRTLLLLSTPRAEWAGSERERLVVALSVQDAPVSLSLPDGGWRVAEGDGVLENGQLALPAHGWAVLLAT